MEESILLMTKRALGIEPDYKHFDPEIIMTINSAIGLLYQLGVGPESGTFAIHGETEKWSDLVDHESVNMLNMVQQYIFYKTRQGFDPPTSSSMMESIEKQIKELEWRLNVAVDPGKAVAP